MKPEKNASFVCIGCRVTSPSVETEYTLISNRFGWRLTRRTDKSGVLVLEWRCPACWARYKQERSLAMTPSEGVPIATAEPPAGTEGAPSSRRKKL